MLDFSTHSDIALVQLQGFYMQLQCGLRDGHLPGKQGRLACIVAKQKSAIIGVVLVHSMILSEEREAGRLKFQLVESQPFGAQAAYVMLLAVHSDHHRRGIASDLVFHGVSRLAMENPDICAVGVAYSFLRLTCQCSLPSSLQHTHGTSVLLSHTCKAKCGSKRTLRVPPF